MSLQDILQKFELLPMEKKKFLSSPMVLVALEGIESKYQLSLALILMELITDNHQNNLEDFLEQKLSITSGLSSNLAQDLRSQILNEFYKLESNQEQLSDKILEMKSVLPMEAKQKNILPDAIKPKNVPILMPPVPAVIKKTEIVAPHDKKNNGFDDLFDEDDRQEVKKFKTRSQDIASFSSAIDWHSKASRIINNLQIKLSDDVLDNRLIIIIINALKGIRKIIDTRNILIKRTTDGGVGLDLNLAESILSAIKMTKIAIEEEQLEKGGSKYKFLLSRDSEPLIKERRAQKPRVEKYIASNKPGLINIEEELESINIKNHPIVDIDSEVVKKDEPKMLMPPLPVIIKDEPKPLTNNVTAIKDTEAKTKILSDNNINISNIHINEMIKAKEPELIIKSEEILKTPMPIANPKMTIPILKPAQSVKKQGFFSRLFSKLFGKKEKVVIVPVQNSKKIKIEDVKKIEVSSVKEIIKESNGHKLVGPIEELEDLTLNDFRNLSSDPAVAINKIEEKIKTLAMESLSKKILAIKAWKKSEVNILYLTILNEAMINHKIFSDIIKERQDKRMTTLSAEEFEVVSDFSKKIRF